MFTSTPTFAYGENSCVIDRDSRLKNVLSGFIKLAVVFHKETTVQCGLDTHSVVCGVNLRCPVKQVCVCVCVD